MGFFGFLRDMFVLNWIVNLFSGSNSRHHLGNTHDSSRRSYDYMDDYGNGVGHHNGGKDGYSDYPNVSDDYGYHGYESRDYDDYDGGDDYGYDSNDDYDYDSGFDDFDDDF